MKIWCCLCFTREEEDEEDYKEVGEEDKFEAMREGVFGNEGNPEGRVGNDDDPEGAEQLGLPASPLGRDRDREEAEQLRMFEDAVVAMRGGGVDSAHWDGTVREGALSIPWTRIARCFEGESSSASVETAVEDHDRDLYNKRAKVHSDFQ